MLLKQERCRVTGTGDQGQLLAEITFPEVAPGVYCIDHTFVDPSLKGQGIGEQLIRAALVQIRENHGRVTATCSYAQRWLDKHPEER